MSWNRRNVLAGGLAAGLTAAVADRTASAATPTNSGANPRVRAIGLEEHGLPPEVFQAWRNLNLPTANTRPNAPPSRFETERRAELDRRLQDFDDQRIEDMDRAGIEMVVLSLTVPGPQGQPDPTRAHDMMVRGNDALAQRVSKRPDRYAGFGCLSMHDVDAACREFERVVKNGFRGVLLNNWQRVGNGESFLTYDDRRFDEFWATAQKLEAPVYLHPGWVPPGYANNVMGPEGALWPEANAAGWNFACTTGTHALRIIATGVFDRYPKAQLILGHNGEHIVTDLWRIDNRLHTGWRRTKGVTPNAPYRAQKLVSAYFRTNVSVTTSGNFSDHGLQHIIKTIGADRVMFSSDYPYEDMIEGGQWMAATPLSQQERVAIARANQIKLLKLPLKA